ncbi:MAG: TatD family hydrolase [Candidatus Micrarchaeia archaeon]
MFDIFDAHCHLDAYNYPEEVISEAVKSGYRIITCGYTLEASLKAVEIAQKNESVYAVVGIAPQQAMRDFDVEWVDKIRALFSQSKVIAIGEIGLDYHWGKTEAERNAQKRCFEAFIKLAEETKKPVVIHSRKAEADVISRLADSHVEKVMLHCFSGSVSEAKAAAERGWLISVPPVSSNGRKKAIKAVGIERILVESDAPYIGKSPLSVRYSISLVADALGISEEEVAVATSENCRTFYGLKKAE